MVTVALKRESRYRRIRAAASGLGHQRDDSQISLFWTLLPAWRCCSVTRAQPNRKPRKTHSTRNCIEQGIIPPAPVRLAGNVRAWPVAEASAIIAAARGERILSKPRRPISETNFSLFAWEARTARQMWGDGEAEAKYDIRVNCDLCGKRLRAGSRWGECEQTPERRREHRRPPTR
jgi:hypothetical protein